MATERKRWPKGAAAARGNSIDAQSNTIDLARDARALIRDARHASARQDWKLLELIMLRLDAHLADIRSNSEYTIRVLSEARADED